MAEENEGLFEPHRIKALLDKNVTKIVTGPASCHVFFITDDGECFGFGRNENGQLGVGHTTRVDSPTSVVNVKKVAEAATGRHHSLFVNADGNVYATGQNRCGQLGLGTKQEMVKSPLPVKMPLGVKGKKVACGAEFSVVLGDDGCVYTFGMPEHGQLGNGTDGQFLAKANKIEYNYLTEPYKVPGLEDITDVSCGNNHTMALTKDGNVFTWGDGGYGKLGHSEQKGEMRPRMVETAIAGKAKEICAGGTSSHCKTSHGIVYMWGITKKTGEANMYPKMIADLSGWDVRSLSVSQGTSLVAADDKVIVWGAGPCFGELALGPGGPKSSASPKIAETLEGVYVTQVASAINTSYFLVRTDDDKEKSKFESFPLFEKDNLPSELPPQKGVKRPPSGKPAAPKAKKAAKTAKTTKPVKEAAAAKPKTKSKARTKPLAKKK